MLLKKKIPEYITEDIEFFSDDFDREGSDEENSNEKLSIHVFSFFIAKRSH